MRLPGPRHARAHLMAEEAVGITAKITHAMREARLQHDPNLTLRRLSDHTRVPPHRLSQVLNTHLGMTFYDYVDGWRVEAARAMLRAYSEATTFTVALAVGFSARSTFNAAFKRATGTTPSAYRRASAAVTARA